MNKLPEFFKQEVPSVETLNRMSLFKHKQINTVCSSAHCPNLSACFKEGNATFMILGNVCTRSCSFCVVAKSKGNLSPPDTAEPRRIAQAAIDMGLRYIVVTSVTRDDLLDAGAEAFARAIEYLGSNLSGTKIEVLIPDFNGNLGSLRRIIDAGPDVIAHNIETVPRLYPEVRRDSHYEISLYVLKAIKQYSGAITKSSLMLGMGEREDEVINVFKDLRQVGCDILTLGQYLSPSDNHYPVKEFISLEKFKVYRQAALGLGFKAVFSGPLIRSSYKARDAYNEARGKTACMT